MTVHDRYKDYIEDQREFFDALITEDWDTYFSPDWDETRRYEVSELFKLIQPKKILDIGCGCGFHDLEMAKYDFVEKVTGLDYSSKSIETANHHYPHPKITRSVGDLTKIEDGSFDLVVSWQVFEHLNHPNAYFEGALKALNNSGWLVIFTPNRYRLHNVLRMIKGKSPEYCDPQHYYEYTPQEIRKIAGKHGLHYVTWFGYRISGTDKINQLSMARRLELGRRWKWFADLFCIVLKKP